MWRRNNVTQSSLVRFLLVSFFDVKNDQSSKMVFPHKELKIEKKLTTVQKMDSM